MTPKEIAVKTKKIIKMHPEYTIKSVYFSPMFLGDLYDQVGDLSEAGITVATTETETEEGTIIGGTISSPKRKMDLGSVLLDGEDIKVKKKLVTVDNLVRFIEHEAEETETKTVEEKEEEKI